MAPPDDQTGGQQRRKRFSNQDYTIGWICALPQEHVAARAFLDEEHEPLPYFATDDNNDYTLGRIGKHYVTIAGLPSGAYGVYSAHKAAVDMLRTFPNIKVGLMVGIGGGAPSLKHDIRFGDVVVGARGVIQYDLGRLIQGQRRQTMPFLAPPPSILLTAISKLRAKHELVGHDIPQRIEAILAVHKSMKENFGRPDATTDRLYKSDVVHPAFDILCVESCGVDDASTILRASRGVKDDDPVIHYGLIASGNQVIRNAKVRDQLASENDVLCFEMEAAGLVDRFPCLIVRGICDYSDSHKNKGWQAYAAMTAAAYTKELLETITPNALETEREIRTLFVHRSDEVIQWLSPPDTSMNQTHARELHQLGTGRWFLDSDKYLSWKSSSPSFLWVYGIPGCGKTILSSVIITDLEDNPATSQEILYFYFDGSDIEKCSTEHAVRSLIYQLYCRRASARRVVDSLYTSYRTSGQQPTYEVLQLSLNTIIQECGEIWIVLDGLDECVTRSLHTEDGIIPWIRNLRNLLSDVHLLVTSRPEQDIRSSIEVWASSQQVVSLQPNLVANDIKMYILSKVEQMSRWQSRPDIQKLIATTLADRANGMFLWVACQFTVLESCLTPQEVTKALARPPEALDDLYAQILGGLHEASKTQAIRLLQILVCSERPLLVEEALALETLASKPQLDAASRMFIEQELARICSSLVHVTLKYHESIGDYVTEIRLVHSSIQDYLQSDRLPHGIQTYFDKDTLAREFPDGLAAERALLQLMIDIYSKVPIVKADSESGASEISNQSSIFSQDTDSTGLSLDSARRSDPLLLATESLAHHLYQDQFVHDLYFDAVRELGFIRFSANHDRLLKIFWKDIFRGTSKPKPEALVKVLAKRQSRSLMTAHILRLFRIEMDSLQEGDASMQRALDQQQDRNYSLNRYLQSQQPLITGADEDDLEDSENDEETDDENGPQGSNPENFHDVEKVLDYIKAGAPYQTFKSNLACLAHPPTNLAEALETKNLRALRRLFRKQFDSIAQDEYAWLQDLEDLGHTRDEIAEILLEEVMDAPWIYFTPRPEPLSVSDTQPEFHLPGCVHKLTWEFHSQDRDTHPPEDVASSGESASLLDIQRLCGLAGITPSSRDIEEWNGSVNFEEGNSAALITYRHSNTRKVINRLEVTLGLFCTAIRQCQAQHLCCDSFTIIKFPSTLVAGGDPYAPSVEVCRIDFSIAFQLLNEVKVLSAAQDITDHNIPTATTLLQDVFRREQPALLSTEAVLPTAIHECALSVQMMSIGFLSYLQAHVGPLHPEFLDTPIRRAKLLGSAIIQETLSFTRIEFDLVELTCVGKMLQGPVLVFRLLETSLTAESADYPSHLKFDLVTNAEDLVDTWGPAQFVVQNEENNFPLAIKIGGGVVTASDTTGAQFHWREGFSFTSLAEATYFNPTKKMQIGSPVSVNKNCTLNEDQCRAHSEAYGHLRYLGTYTPGWERTEKQLGLQGGQYLVLQANAAYHRYAGRTLKQYRLEQGDHHLVSFLDDWWAVQVSLCTNVARRVPLRQMVADLFPVFASTLTARDDCLIWEKLQSEGKIFAAFRGPKVQQWLREQPASHHSLILRIIRHILKVLSESGLDRKGKTFLVSWPYGSDVYRCLEISLSQHESSWAPIIADSEDSATFAYASPCCLETEEHRCRRDDSCIWRNTVPLLETAVTVCVTREQLVAPPVIGQLVHGGKYFFKTFDAVHIVKVEQPDPATVAKLVRQQNRVGASMIQRLYARTQLRERGRMQMGAGNKAWLMASI